jgi:23S rRNA (cytosine1962-C5)-methyltransferase
LTTVRVNRKAADRAASGHPWIFVSDVTDRGDAQPGDVVKVADPRGRPIGVAHYSSTSQITLRLLSSKPEPIDQEFFRRRLTAAIRHRERVVQDSNACRLVFSEADLLPGLIVDRYGACLVIQTLSQGMDRQRDLIVHCLKELLAPAGILARNDAAVRKLESLPLEVVVLFGEIPQQVAIEMNGLHLEADLLKGQKTGIYLDQRENYLAAAKAVDSSASALATAESNARANNISNIQFRQADVFDFLSGIDRKYGTIVLDPPAFAKSRKMLDDAAKGYKEINLRALKLLEPGGILVTCSCSHHVSESMLFEIVAEAALDAGKTLRVLERRTQAADHPILLTVPETLYLKCQILEVLGR